MKSAQVEKKKKFLPELKTSGTPADVISQAILKGADLDKLEKLLVLQERFEANEAKKAYHRSMAAFKADPPEIKKDKKVAFGNTRYDHASLANVAEKINKSLSRHGLYASWRVVQNETISVTCRISHEQGYFEEATVSGPADSSGSKNPIQQIGSSVAYLERYSLMAVSGLAAGDMDNDGRNGGSAKTAFKIGDDGKIKKTAVEAEVVGAAI